MSAPAVETTRAEVSRELADMFLRAEQSGLKLATLGRTAALLLLGVWLVGSRADDPVRMHNYLIALSVFAALGLLHYSLVATRFDRPWTKYLFVTVDIAIPASAWKDGRSRPSNLIFPSSTPITT